MKTDQQIIKNIYFNNEVSANKSLTNGCFFSAVGLLIVWVLYLTGAFQISGKLLTIVNVVFPILIIVLGSTVFYTKTKLVEKPGFKYFLIMLFCLSIFTINVLLPKHGLLMWAACIVIVNHFFNPKIMLFTYITVAILMFFALYFALFIGEWDPALLNGAYYIEIDGVDVNVDTATYEQRVKWIHFLMDQGDNRYLKTFIYYYIPRLIILTVISQIGYAVSKRTMHLLTMEAKDSASREKLKSELNVASSIQYSVLPKEVTDGKTSIYGLMEPAKEVGGDFYDYFYIDETHIALVIADVSGKGIPAALFMMKTETLIKSLTMSFRSNTSLIMKRSNIALCNNNDANIFVTCWLGIVNLNSGELKYTNAGHNKVMVIHDGVARYLDDKPGVVLGAFDGTVYKENKITLSTGDKILLYTDGVTESQNAYSLLYGEDRLLKYGNKNTDKKPKEFVLGLKEDIDKFAGCSEQFDDITILAYEYTSESTITESRIFNADLKELDNLFDYSSNLLERIGFSPRDIKMINTALEEIFVNVANYAYEDKGYVEVTLSKEKDKVTFVFKDNGKPFNPLDNVEPNIDAPAEEREIGGLGIFMVKKIMDEVKYDYLDNKNILTLVKYKKK